MCIVCNMMGRWASRSCVNVQAPVFRELYSEKRVVAEERRLRVDDSPMGSFQVTAVRGVAKKDFAASHLKLGRGSSSQRYIRVS